MTPYIFTISIVFVSFLYTYKRPDNRIFELVVLLVCFIICFGYMTGSDWRAYEEIYNSYKEPNNFYWRFLFVEPLYLCFNIIGNEAQLNFWTFYLIIKVLIFYKVISIFKRFCPFNISLLALTFYLGFWGIMVFIDTPFRNLIAVYIFLCSIRYFYERNFKKYLLFCLLAILCHFSAFLLIPLYFCNRSFSNRTIVNAFIMVNLLLLNADWVISLIGKLIFFLPQVAAKIENYTIGEEAETTGAGKILSLGYFIHIFFFLVILKSRKIITNKPCGNLIFNMGILYIFIFRLGLTVLIFSRIQLFISIFYSIAIALSLYSMKSGQKLFYVFIIYALALFSNINQMRNVYMVPYTNYFFYLDKDLSFEERSDYNFIHSPYKEIEK